jgi:hypothetical protein
MHPQIKQEDEDFAYSNGNLPLSVAFKMHSSIPPRQSGKLHEKPIVNKCKREPIGGPNSGRARSIGVFKEKWKSPMQPFAHLPQKTKARGKIPLDIMELQMKWKTIHEPVGTIHSRVYSSDNEEKESDFPEGGS